MYVFVLCEIFVKCAIHSKSTTFIDYIYLTAAMAQWCGVHLVTGRMGNRILARKVESCYFQFLCDKIISRIHRDGVRTVNHLVKIRYAMVLLLTFRHQLTKQIRTSVSRAGHKFKQY